ncbi:hypothetical protein C943_02860 [Mariniradius saccharolyticus AK6]|uniref:Uncharacterized protein n=1 Tax=Mariniradius saccharolyticus AK6 TaxID=1239962 RepID=M7XJI4_9BACT|nr:hypothetical protein C943_02860 [Mariniradius saccharolyticus AK6]
MVEQLGATTFILNQPFNSKNIKRIKQKINIPIISSVSIKNCSFRDRVNVGPAAIT